jgi:hypothetical protein
MIEQIMLVKRPHVRPRGLAALAQQPCMQLKELRPLIAPPPTYETSTSTKGEDSRLHIKSSLVASISCVCALLRGTTSDCIRARRGSSELDGAQYRRIHNRSYFLRRCNPTPDLRAIKDHWATNPHAFCHYL